MMKKRFAVLLALLTLSLLFAGCSQTSAPSASQTPGKKTIMVAAAASLQKCFTDKLIPAFNAKYPDIAVQGTYDSSGKLQTQIEQGLNADVFMSAATKQMDTLKGENLIASDTIANLLENKLVLITSASSSTKVTSFETIAKAKTIAIGDPASVPAGQYAKEALTTLKLYDSLQKKFSLGTNVTEVLNWVAEGSAEVGIVYATDASGNSKVKVLANAPAGSITTPVVYPVGMVSASKNQDAAKLFIAFLQTDEAKGIFQGYGFTIYSK